MQDHRARVAFARPKLLEVGRGEIVLADWVELELLVGRQREWFAIDDLASLLRDEPPADFDRYVGDDPEPSGASGDAEYGFAALVFSELGQRAQWLKHQYPIDIEDGVATVMPESGSLRLYRFLVALRARQLFKGRVADDANEPGYLFEELATVTAKAYASGSERARFGKAGGERGDELPEPFEDAVIELASRMGEKPAEHLTGRGDYAADAFGWRPFGDPNPGQLVVALQAGIGEGDWLDKPVAKRWLDRRIIQFIAEPLTGSAFPESLSLYSTHHLRGQNCGVPLDRLRIASLVRDADLDAATLERMDSWVGWARERIPR